MFEKLSQSHLDPRLYIQALMDTQPERFTREGVSKWTTAELNTFCEHVDDGIALTHPVTVEVYRALMVQNATVQGWLTLRELHVRGLQKACRWDHFDDFVPLIERVFSQSPYTGWLLCLGYPSDTPWLQRIGHTHHWDTTYGNLLYELREVAHSLSNNDHRVLLGFSTTSQLMDVLSSYPRTNGNITNRDHYVETLMRSEKRHEPAMVYALAYMGDLHRWRKPSVARDFVTYGEAVDVDAGALWNDPLLLELSRLREKDAHALHPAFPELAMVNTLTEWVTLRLEMVPPRITVDAKVDFLEPSASPVFSV